MQAIVKYIQETLSQKKDHPNFNSGDNISVHYKIIEGNKERIQVFKGDVINIKGNGDTKMFTVRKLSNGTGVERIFPFNSPLIEKIEFNKAGKVRRAKLFYIRGLKGKAMRIKEKRMAISNEG
ncbi:MAG: 50S ribosomal protein L19 [Chitinophagales bacterium]|nr:50S ribosomal protein L19 [Chitinophagales bacterium]